MTITSEQQAALAAIPHCFQTGGKLLLCSNGGSAADCAHITGELAKDYLKKRPLPLSMQTTMGEPWAQQLQGALPAIDLTANNALIAAIINDLDGHNVYAQ